MKLEKFLAASVVIPLTILSYSATAQMRPDCFEDPYKPGACFVAGEPGGAINCEEGAILFASIGDFNDNQFNRANPTRDGVFTHQSAKELLTAFCYWDDIFSGNCIDTSGPDPVPLEGAFLGTTTLSSNGFINPDTGGAHCPFVSKARGMVTNVNRAEMLEVDMFLHRVPDQNGGCRLKECRIIATDQ